MAENSKIEWTHHTVNFWWGCAKVSPACAHCYAEGQAARFYPGLWGADGERRIRLEAATKEAFRYERQAIREGRRLRVFTNSMADFFEDRRDLDAARLEALDVILQTPHLDWLCLTKRPDKIILLLGLAIARLDKAITLKTGDLNAESSCRETNLPGRVERGVGGRFGGQDLASQEADSRQVEGWDESSPLREGASGKRDRSGLSPDSGHVGRKADLHGSTSVGVDPLLRGDPARNDDQSPEWGQVGQPSGQPGVSHLQRSAPSCDSSTGREACGCSGQEPPQDFAHGSAGSGDSCPPSHRGASEESGRRFRDEAEGHLGDLLPKNLEASAVELRDWLKAWLNGHPPANVWLGTTVEDQERADQRIPHLLNVPAAVRFLSCEPLLGPVDLFKVPRPDVAYFRVMGITGCISPRDEPDDFIWGMKQGLDWVICGGESGRQARPMHPDWARSLRDQCAAAGVPFLFKQWGEWAPGDVQGYVTDDDRCRVVDPVQGLMGRPWLGWGKDRQGRTVMNRYGKKEAGRLLDGKLHDGYPEVR